MFAMGYGIGMDVESLTFAALDRDDTTTSRDCVLNVAGSRYFIERAPLADHGDLDRRTRAGKLALALEIPPGFGRDIARGAPVQVSVWIDGSMPTRAETVRTHVVGMHEQWLTARARAGAGAAVAAIRIATPRESMPEFVQVVMLAAPTTHFVLLAQGVLFPLGATVVEGGVSFCVFSRAIRDKLVQHEPDIGRYGDDLPEIAGWRWQAPA